MAPMWLYLSWAATAAGMYGVVPAICVNELSVLNSPLSMPSKKKFPLSSWVMPW